eukprot:6184946-Pleurochrysis_carterae.AAC.2
MCRGVGSLWIVGAGATGAAPPHRLVWPRDSLRQLARTRQSAHTRASAHDAHPHCWAHTSQRQLDHTHLPTHCMATTTMAYDAPIYPGYDADAVVASSGQYFQGRRSDARAMACYGSELETPGSRQSVQFDDNGRLYLFLSIGHHVTAAERKQLRWTVFARPDIEGLIEDVSFKVLSESAVVLEAITPAPGPYELQRTTPVSTAPSSLFVVITINFAAWLQQKPHRQEHDIPLGQGKSHQMDDVMVVLHDPRFALNWGPHEAPPGNASPRPQSRLLMRDLFPVFVRFIYAV